MNEIACFCGMRYSFVGDGGICPRCGEPSTVKPMGAEVEAQMRRELDEWLATIPEYGSGS